MRWIPLLVLAAWTPLGARVACQLMTLLTPVLLLCLGPAAPSHADPARPAGDGRGIEDAPRDRDKTRWIIRPSGVQPIRRRKLGPPEMLGAPGFAAAWREIVERVRSDFHDAGRAAEWAAARAEGPPGAADAREFSRRVNEALAELKTSHTRHYASADPEHAMLLAIFQHSLGVDRVEHDSIGADMLRLPQGFFAASVFAGSPAEKAGLLRGDRIVEADGETFDPWTAFRGRAGQVVSLSVERQAGGPLLEIRVSPRRVNPRQEWLQAQRLGSRIVERGGRSIAYAPLWSCAGEEHEGALRDALAGPFREADALVLDFRGGWGGCNPEFLDLFNPYVPSLSWRDRSGGEESPGGPWAGPAFALVDGRTRSGKEVAAFALQRRGVATLVGARTAGAVAAGRPFLLSDGSILYLAVGGVLVDGERLEGRGVEPDAPIADELAYAQGRDPQMDRALDLASDTCGMMGPPAWEGVSTRLKTDPELRARQGEFARAVVEACGVVRRFAARHGWQARARGLFDSVEIFGTQEGLWRRVVELDRLPADARIPTDGLSAGIEARTLAAVTPQEYARLRPEYSANPDSWMRVLAHEMIHRLHAAVLDGREDAMGPKWFFEGFAVVASGDPLGAGIRFASAGEALAEAKGAVGRGSYAQYAAAVRYFMALAPLPELLRRAGQDDFEDWLKDLGP